MKNTYYSYDITKVVNVVLFIIHSFGHRIHLLLLNRILYDADILHLSRYGFLITRDRYILMKKGVIPANTYFLYTRFIENDETALTHNIREFFSITGHFIHAHQKYDDGILSASEVGCLFETIRSYKNKERIFFKENPVSSISRNMTLFNEISVADMAILAGVNDTMYSYILDSMKCIFSHKQANSVSGTGKISFLSSIVLGSVIKVSATGYIYIIAGISFQQYALVKVYDETSTLFHDMYDDLKRSFIMLTHKQIVDCSRLYVVSHNELYACITKGDIDIIGQVNIMQTEMIASALQASSTIPARLKEGFILHV